VAVRSSKDWQECKKLVSLKTTITLGLVGTALVTVLLFRNQLVQGAFALGQTAGDVITAPFLGLAQSLTSFEQTINAALNPLGCNKTSLSTPLSPQPATSGTPGYCPNKAVPNCAVQALIRSLDASKLGSCYQKTYSAGNTNYQPIQQALCPTKYSQLLASCEGRTQIYLGNIALGANPCTGEFDIRKSCGAYALFCVKGTHVNLTPAELAYDKSKGIGAVQL